MCSWCYGFAPVLRKLHEAFPEYPLVCIAGGLRPGERAEKLDAALGRFLRKEWKQISEVTGQPFTYSILDRADFLYDTEPADRAVVTARRLVPENTLEFFELLQSAFYRDGLDITSPEVLADLFAKLGDRATFVSVFSSNEAIRETQGDFEFAQTTGMTAFPSLVFARDGRGQLLTRGYIPFEELEQRMRSAVGAARPGQAEHS